MFTYNSEEEEEEGRSLKPRIVFVTVLCVAGKMAVCALDDAIDFLDRLIDRFSVLQNPLPQCSVSKLPPQNDAAAASSSSSQNSKLSKNADPRKEAKSRATPKVSTKSESIASQSGPNSEAEVMFSKAHIQVGCVLEVSDHPASEKLFLCKVEVAKGVTRQVVAGLRKFLSPSELEGRKVCVVCNLKPAKLAGQLSEAMILAGEKTESTEHLIVKVLDVPRDALVGERILIEGTSSLADPVKQLSSKIWDKIVSLFKVEDEIATFDGKPLVTTSGCVRVPGLLNGSIH